MFWRICTYSSGWVIFIFEWKYFGKHVNKIEIRKPRLLLRRYQKVQTCAVKKSMRKPCLRYTALSWSDTGANRDNNRSDAGKYRIESGWIKNREWIQVLEICCTINLPIELVKSEKIPQIINIELHRLSEEESDTGTNLL